MDYVKTKHYLPQINQIEPYFGYNMDYNSYIVQSSPPSEGYPSLPFINQGSYIYNFAPIPVSPANSYFDISELIDQRSYPTIVPIFENFYNDWCQLDSTSLELVSPIVKSNDIVHPRRHSSFIPGNYGDKSQMIYQCDICGKTFDRKYVLKRHRGAHSSKREFHCKPCNMSFYRKDIFDRHLTTKKCRKAHASARPALCHIPSSLETK